MPQTYAPKTPTHECSPSPQLGKKKLEKRKQCEGKIIINQNTIYAEGGSMS